MPVSSWTDTLEAQPERLDPLGLEARAERRIRAGPLEEAAQKRADVESGPAGDDRHSPARDYVGDGRVRKLHETRGGHALRGGDHVEQMVWGARTLGCGRLARADIQAAIHLLRVGRDDLTAKLGRRAQRERRLPRRGRADDDQEGASDLGPRASAGTRIRPRSGSDPRGLKPEV
jgi:hypothetical protein